MSPSTDLRGVVSGSASPQARAAVERALAHLMSYADTPEHDLDAAAAADPAWAMPHVMRAGYLLGLGDPAQLGAAATALAHADPLVEQAPPRERQHADAVRRLLAGRWHDACAIWDALLIEQPLDALALHWAHLWDLRRGDREQLRLRTARVLPEWDTDDPLQPCVVALYAFGLAENNLFAQAEDAGRQALRDNRGAAWATRAVTEVMAMQGRFDEGTAWLREHQPAWADGNRLAPHLWWQMALFRLEAMDIAGGQRLHDCHFGDTAALTLSDRIDSAALLWRLHLLGADVMGPCRALLDAWPLDPAQAGHCAFNDWHVVLAMIGADDIGGAEGWVARCAERALDAADSGHANHLVSREVGLPLMRAVLALARGDSDAACDLLHVTRARTGVLGGSHTQRDLIDQTLLSAATHAGRERLGRALLNERLMARPATPLTRHWIEQLGARSDLRA